MNDFEMRDGVVDVDVAIPASRGFSGFQFRLANDGANAEEVYLRQHKSGLPDAMQYTPILNTRPQLANLQWAWLHRRGGYPERCLFHLHLEVVGAQAKFYVKDIFMMRRICRPVDALVGAWKSHLKGVV